LADALPLPTVEQTSPSKNDNLPSISPPHLLTQVPSSCRASFCFANLPTCISLYMRFLSVGAEVCRQLPSDIASQQRPCSWLTLLATKRVVDLHHQVITHVGHTNKRADFSKNLPLKPVSLDLYSLFVKLFFELSPCEEDATFDSSHR